MVAGQVASRSRDQRRQSGHEVNRGEDHMGSAIPEWAFEFVDNLPGFIRSQPVEADGGARDVATQALQTLALVRLAGDGGVEREAVPVHRERFGPSYPGNQIDRPAVGEGHCHTA